LSQSTTSRYEFFNTLLAVEIPLPDLHTYGASCRVLVHIGAQVQVRITARMLEIFLKAELIATHARLFKRGARSTLEAHRPHKHRAVIDTSLARLIERANRISPAVAAVLTAQFNRRRHPEEALRSAQGEDNLDIHRIPKPSLRIPPDAGH